jgi:hypothetical protein
MTTLARTGREGGVDPRIGMLMLFEAATLAVASVLHLAGNVHGRGAPFNAQHAGIAEAIIGAVLAGGALAVVRAPRPARMVGLVTTGFAIVGFLLGLNFTVRGGDSPDVAYHLVMLPILVATLVFIARAQNPAVDGE